MGDDNEVSHCNICANKLVGSLFKSGKHHCRKCGAIICADCSNYKYLNHRICSNCNRLLNETNQPRMRATAVTQKQNISQSTTTQIVENGLETISSTESKSSMDNEIRSNDNLSETLTTHSLKRPIPPPPIRHSTKSKPPPPPNKDIVECKLNESKKTKKRKKHRRHHRSSPNNEIDDISTEVFLKLLLMIDVEENEKKGKKRKRKRKKHKKHKKNSVKENDETYIDENKMNECDEIQCNVESAEIVSSHENKHVHKTQVIEECKGESNQILNDNRKSSNVVGEIKETIDIIHDDSKSKRNDKKENGESK